MKSKADPDVSQNISLWSYDKIHELYQTPLLELIHQANSVHREFFSSHQVQLCKLLSVKTGSCPEDCAYCPQSAHYQTFVESERLMPLEKVLREAKKAKEEGASRFCMGAAWRNLKDDKNFEEVLRMVHEVNKLGLEVCCSMGMLTLTQARRLKEAGLYAYNHNIDTSPSFYSKVISTRKFSERTDTIKNVQKAGISVCCGGILGLGETHDERVGFIYTLSQMEPPPDSIPINMLVAVEGTPLQDQAEVPIWDMLRVIATVRVVIGGSMIRLSAGRVGLSFSDQTLCFLAGANSIFLGEKLLTTPNNDHNEDKNMLEILGLLKSN